MTGDCASIQMQYNDALVKIGNTSTDTAVYTASEYALYIFINVEISL